MLAQHTHPDLASLLLAYLRGQGSSTCLECLDNLSLPPIYRDYAASQDVISWDGFITGWVLAKLLPLHSTLSHDSSRSGSATRWISGLISQLCLVTHTQWIYRCVLVYDLTTSTIISAHKEELLSKIQKQLDIGPDGLDKQDRFLLECNFDKLATTAGEHQEHWLLAIQVAREASRIRAQQVETAQSCSHSRKRKRAHA